MDMDLEPEVADQLNARATTVGINATTTQADIENELRKFLEGGAHEKRDGSVPMTQN